MNQSGTKWHQLLTCSKNSWTVREDKSLSSSLKLPKSFIDKGSYLCSRGGKGGSCQHIPRQQHFFQMCTEDFKLFLYTQSGTHALGSEISINHAPNENKAGNCPVSWQPHLDHTTPHLTLEWRCTQAFGRRAYKILVEKIPGSYYFDKLCVPVPPNDIEQTPRDHFQVLDRGVHGYLLSLKQFYSHFLGDLLWIVLFLPNEDWNICLDNSHLGGGGE